MPNSSHSIQYRFVYSAMEEAKPLGKLLQEIEKPCDPIFESIHAFMNIKNHKSLNHALKLAAKINWRSLESNMAIYFLLNWSGHSRRKEEAATLVSLANGLLDENTLPRLRFFLEYSIIFSSLENNDEEYLKKSMELFETFSRKPTKPEAVVMISLMLKLACAGYAAPLLKISEDALHKLPTNNFLERRLIENRFLNAVETADFETADILDKKLNALPHDRHPYSVIQSCGVRRALLHLMTSDVVTITKDDPEIDTFNDALYSTYYLLHGEAAKSLMAAKRFINKEKKLKEINGFFVYTHLRAQLANRQVDAARLLLKKITSKTNHFMNSFFGARICLLEGKRDEAIHHFAAVSDACEYFDAERRLDLELRLALEMSHGDLRYLAKMAGSQNSSENKIVISKQEKTPGRFIGQSPASQKIEADILRYAPLPIPILITGETGVGKDVIARAIHKASPRCNQPFLTINCGAVADSLLQAELFGYESGAYTGASKKHKGIFEAAGKGTVFLDEIGEVSPQFQVSLLRVLEMGEIRPVGSATTRPCSCRIIAATNAALDKAVEKGEFRQDLLYRLERLRIKIPPLRQRPQDIIPLAKYFFEEGASSKTKIQMSDALQEAIQQYTWPGNIRQLRNEIERIRLLHSGGHFFDLQDSDLLNQHSASPFCSASNASLLTSGPDFDDKIASLASSNPAKKYSRMRRLDFIRQLFHQYGKLTRQEVAQLANVSPPTATHDLRDLCDSGEIKKIMPSRSPRSHYFVSAEK